ncbi:MAG: hypothetical protein RI101_09755 [Nitrospira sp.]|jgi:hypothetical protein|nr:hypothetical protein [Nitrospira sp.]
MNVVRVIVGIGLSLVLIGEIGCVSFAETPGERFDREMKKFADTCARAKLKLNDTACDILKLKPADPFATEEGRFAHSIKIPNPLPEDSGYKPGMTSQEYFDHLCKTEAGEFIYKTVENVHGLIQLRLRGNPTDYELEHLYAMEDPYGHSVGVRDHPEEYFVQPAIGKYQFIETPLSKGAKTKEGMKYRRFYRDEKAYPGRDYQTAANGRFIRVPYIVAEESVSSPQSRYGYTWRGITRPHDRELGIAGGELIILDIQTNEVLAVRRGFVRSGYMRNMTGVWWLAAQKCSKGSLKTDAQFINQVLKPALVTQERENESK